MKFPFGSIFGTLTDGIDCPMPEIGEDGDFLFPPLPPQDEIELKIEFQPYRDSEVHTLDALLVFKRDVYAPESMIGSTLYYEWEDRQRHGDIRFFTKTLKSELDRLQKIADSGSTEALGRNLMLEVGSQVKIPFAEHLKALKRIYEFMENNPV